MKQNLCKFFVAFSILEFIISIILFVNLPETIQINFSFLLTTPVSSGNRLYIFTLPTAMFVVASLYKYILDNFFTPFWNLLFVIVNSVTACITMYFLLQLFMLG